jgi:hypothetical protein
MDQTTYLWYWDYTDFSPALGEYSSQHFDSSVNSKFSLFLTIQYDNGGFRTILLDPKEIDGSVINFSGILYNQDGLPIQGSTTISPQDPPQCNADAYTNWKAQLNAKIDELDNAAEGDVIKISFAVDVDLFNPAWVNCSAQMNTLLGSELETTTITTTDCVNQDPASAAYQNDSCCSDRAAWYSVCRPRPVSTIGEAYNIDTSNLAICGSSKCTQSFLEDYINSPSQHCEELSTAIAQYTLDKRIL